MKKGMQYCLLFLIMQVFLYGQNKVSRKISACVIKDTIIPEKSICTFSIISDTILANVGIISQLEVDYINGSINIDSISKYYHSNIDIQDYEYLPAVYGCGSEITDDCTGKLVYASKNQNKFFHFTKTNIDSGIYYLEGVWKMPSNSILKIDQGGLIESISGNGEIIGDNTFIDAEMYKIISPSVKLSGTWVNTNWFPEWFGAVGDGVTSDIRAVDHLLSVIPKHCIMTLSKNYHLDTSILLTKPIIIDGLDRGGITGTPDGYSTGTNLFHGFWICSDSITVKDIFIDSLGVILEGTISNITLDGIVFKNRKAISSQKNCIQSDDGLIEDTITNIKIINCLFENFLGQVIDLVGHNDGIIFENNIIQNMNFNSAPSMDLIAFGDIVGTTGISSHKTKNVLVKNNIIKKISTTGNRFRVIEVLGDNVIISGNIIEDVSVSNYNYGLTVIRTSGDNIIISNNTLKGISNSNYTGNVDEASLIVSKNKSKVVISNNIMEGDCFHYGIHVSGESIISNNRIQANSIGKVFTVSSDESFLLTPDTALIESNYVKLIKVSDDIRSSVLSATTEAVVQMSDNYFDIRGGIFFNNKYRDTAYVNMDNNTILIDSGNIIWDQNGWLRMTNNKIYFSHYSYETKSLIRINEHVNSTVGFTFKNNYLYSDNNCLSYSAIWSNSNFPYVIDNEFQLEGTHLSVLRLEEVRKGIVDHNNFLIEKINPRYNYLYIYRDVFGAPDSLYFTNNNISKSEKVNDVYIFEFNNPDTISLLYQANNYIEAKSIVELDDSETLLENHIINNDFLNVESITRIGMNGVILRKNYSYQTPYRSLTINNILNFVPADSPPLNPQLGDVYCNLLDKHLYYFNGNAWIVLDN